MKDLPDTKQENQQEGELISLHNMVSLTSRRRKTEAVAQTLRRSKTSYAKAERLRRMEALYESLRRQILLSMDEASLEEVAAAVSCLHRGLLESILICGEGALNVDRATLEDRKSELALRLALNGRLQWNLDEKS